MTWIVRLKEKETGVSIHGHVKAANFSKALKAAEDEFGEDYTIQLVYPAEHSDRVAHVDEGKGARASSGQ